MTPIDQTTAPALDLPVQAVSRPASRGWWYLPAKRLMDVVVGLLLLLVLLPLLAVTAAVIRLDSPGPALFTQARMGARRIRGGEPGTETWALVPFRLYKFRSMRADADESLHVEHIRHFTQRSVDDVGGGRAAFKLADDPRVTRVGRFLRRSSIDELPQLLNVVKGEMSLVGPRPVPLYEVAGYDQAAHYARFAAKPGVTGLWQVCGRGDLSFEDMIALDRELIERRSLLLDILILLRTIPAVVRGAGAS